MSKNLVLKKKESSMTTKETLFKNSIMERMPEFVQKVETKEDLGNAMYETGQEFLLVIDDVLERYYNFTPEKIKAFHADIQDILKGVKEFEKAGLNILSVDSTRTVGEMHENGELFDALKELAQIRNTKNRMARTGLEYPFLPEAKAFIKKLKK